MRLILAGWLFLGMSAAAQVSTGTISGTVTDASGAVLPGVDIVILNEDTGLSRTVTTDAAGRYSAPSLSLGNFQVTATQEGFQTDVRRGIVLTVGRNAVVDMVLAVGTVTQTVEVTGEAPLIETTSSTISSLVDDKQIRALPLNGRDLIQLATLNPGVVNVRNTEAEYGSGYGAQISVAGARSTSNSFTMDGTDANDSRNRTPGSAAGIMMGVEAVREFSVLSHSYSAEHGRAAGGVINLVTKSGTNELHGSVFEFLRNSKLDARNFFDLEEPPPFKRNQFGFSLGGPIKKSKTFFFGNYEGLRDRLGLTNTINVLTADAREGRLPGTAPFAVHPNIQPYLQFYPLPNGRDFGGGTAELIYTTNQPTNENFYTARVDHSISDSASIFARYTGDFADRFVPEDDVRYFGSADVTRNQIATIEYTHILTPQVISTTRLGFNRSANARQETPYDIEPSVYESLSFVPGKPFGDGRVTGLARFWGADAGLNPEESFQNTYEASNDLSVSRDNHFFKMGLNIKRFQFNQKSPGRVGGRLRFRTVLNFLKGQPRSMELLSDDSTYDRYWRQSLFGFYIQDDWNVNPGLTLNLGLRYEPATVPKETQGRMANVIDFANDTDIKILEDGIFQNPSLRTLAPRFGFAWDPRGSAKTVFRGGFGLFFDPVLVHWLHSAGSRMPPFFEITEYIHENAFNRYRGAQADASPYPNLLSVPGIEPGLNNIVMNTFPDKMNSPYMIRYNLNIQRELIPGTVMLLGYAGSRGVKVGRFADANMAVPQVRDGLPFFPAGSPRRNPVFGEMRVRSADVNSFYNSLLVSLVRRTAQGLNYQVSYTFSRSVDEASGTQGGDYITEEQELNWSDRKMSRGLSAFHTSHVFNYNSTYALPFGTGMTGLGGTLLKGWQVNGILSLSTGFPFTVTMDGEVARDVSDSSAERPDLRPGASNNPVLGGPDKYFDTSVFAVPSPGRYGSLGRNTIIGPGLATVDVGVEKLFSVRENVALQFRTEVFNLLNRANFRVPDSEAVVVFDGDLDPVGSAGRLTNTTTSARQIQFGLKLVF